MNIERVNRLLRLLKFCIESPLYERRKSIPKDTVGLDLPKFKEILQLKKEKDRFDKIDRFIPDEIEEPVVDKEVDVDKEKSIEIQNGDEKIEKEIETEKEIEKNKKREQTLKLVKTKLKSKLGYDEHAKLRKYIDAIVGTLKEKGLEQEEIYDIISYIIYTLEKDNILPKFPDEKSSEEEIFNWLNKAVEENLAGLIINIV